MAINSIQQKGYVNLLAYVYGYEFVEEENITLVQSLDRKQKYYVHRSQMYEDVTVKI